MAKAERSNNGGKTGDGKFAPGNRYGKGRPAGSRNRASLAVEDLLDGQAQAITQKAIEKALEGDSVALRLCLERLCPPRKARPVAISLPKVKTPADCSKASTGILEAVAGGDITPDEGQALAGLLETHRRTLETEDLERRISALEQAHSR